MKWCFHIIILIFFLGLVNAPLTEATPILEVFTDGTMASSDILSEELLCAVEQGEVGLVVWHSNPNSSLHISAASERAGDLGAKSGDVFIQGIQWNMANGSLPTNLKSINITIDVNQGNNGLLILQASTTLEENLSATVVLQWLLLKKNAQISNHPIGPSDSKVVSYHAWDSNVNRSSGAENNWTHQIDTQTLESWNLENEDLIVVASLVSLDSDEIFGSGETDIPFKLQSNENSRDFAISMLLFVTGTIACLIVVFSERRRQKDMPNIRPVFQRNNEREDFLIDINTGNASIRITSIGGNGYWRYSGKDLPIEIPPNTNREIMIRQTSKNQFEPCSIRLEVEGHERWVLDLEFPESDSDSR
ncbi:MAG TPA: hypothetical protein QF555_06325 [Candidatus Thalassarchaeaceae archaeon]|nr:hypothetical protein [Candidatus Thalassarchaeaceae archaeon]